MITISLNDDEVRTLISSLVLVQLVSITEMRKMKIDTSDLTPRVEALLERLISAGGEQR